MHNLLSVLSPVPCEAGAAALPETDEQTEAEDVSLASASAWRTTEDLRVSIE